MPEEIPRQPEKMLDVAQAQQLLGYEVVPTPGIGPDEYDERRRIIEVALEAKEKMRQALADGAKAAKIEVSPEQLAAWEPNEQEQASIRSGLRRERVRARMLDGFADFIAEGRMTTNAMGTALWPIQQDILHSTGYFMLCMPPTTPEGGKGGIIGAAPGTGKTGVTAVISAAAKYKEDPNERLKIIVIENTINVMQQTHGKDGTRGYGKFAPGMDVGLRYQEVHDLDHDIVIMPSASFHLLMERGEMPDADLVIADEIDVYAGGAPGKNLRKYGADKIVIGLSATADETSRDLLPHEIYNMNLPEAIRQGLLAPTTAEVIDVEANIDKSQLPESPAERKAELELLRLRARMDDAKIRIKKAVERGVGVVVRCPPGNDIDYARVFAAELSEMNVVGRNDGSWMDQFTTIIRKGRFLEIGGKAQSTTKGRKLQQEAFDRYREETIDGFCYVRAIGRGFDAPNTKEHYDLDTTGNWREKLQGFGRATRLLLDENGKPVLHRGRPIEARLFSYHDPDRPDQYTGVMALGGQPGQSSIRVGHESTPRPKPGEQQEGGARRMPLPPSLGAAVLAVTIETITVEHDETVPTQIADDAPVAEEVILVPETATDDTPEPAVVEQPEAPAEHHTAPAADDPNQLTFSTAAARLGVSSIFLGKLYVEHGFDRNSTITVVDLNAMLELSHPELRIEPLPERGYMSDREVLELAGLVGKISAGQLRMRANYRDVPYRKFFGADGKAGFYFADDDIEGLLEKLTKPVESQE